MKLYIASALANYQTILLFQELLEHQGFRIACNWAQEYANELTRGQKPTLQERKTFAQTMAEAVRQSDALILVLPGKRGAHIEMGIALGCRKPVLVINDKWEDDIDFYHLPGVRIHRSFRSALAELLYLQSSQP